MEQDKKTKEYLEKIGQIKLSESSRVRILGEIESYAELHSVSNEEVSRSNNQVSQISVWQTVLSTLNQRTMPVFAVIAIILIGGGTSMAAQGSLPGDILYPVKINVNENVRSALALSANAEAELQAKLLEERVTEAQELESEGRLSGQLAFKVEEGVATQYEKAVMANAEADDKTDSQLSLSLGRLASLSTGGSVAMEETVNSKTRTIALGMPVIMEYDESAEDGDMAVEADVVMTTSMAADPIDVGYLQMMTSARLESLRKVLDLYQAKIDSDTYVEFETMLDEADRLMIQVLVQSNTDLAREILFEVADLVGEVEAMLSTMGEVTIDTETGAIIDIDFNNPPAEEPGYEVDPNPMPLPMPVSPDFSGDVDYGDDEDIDEIMIDEEIGIEKTSEIVF